MDVRTGKCPSTTDMICIHFDILIGFPWRDTANSKHSKYSSTIYRQQLPFALPFSALPLNSE